METRQKEQLMRWLKKYPWLWAIRVSWCGALIKAERVRSAKEFLLANLSDCEYYLYLEENSGPRVYKSPLQGDGKLANTLMEAVQNERYVKMVAVVRHHPMVPYITIYKPPQNGWNGFFKRAWDILH